VTEAGQVQHAQRHAGSNPQALGPVPLASVRSLEPPTPLAVHDLVGRRRWSRARPAAKRSFDVVASGVGIVVLSPVFLVLSLAVLLSEGRPVIYRQVRVGRGGRAFTMFKFRSMVTDAHYQLADVQELNQRSGPLFKVQQDPRTTRVGRFLRVTSLDELPQLFNVLGGSMSLVGPRPALYEEREHFPEALLERETIRPGLTGLWQVEARLDPDFDRYHQLDLEYVRSHTFFGDLRLLARTPVVVVRDAFRHTRADAKDQGSPQE
jgi:lipopolysaccharide/colanic/teichoic acid biosynthesis glycosyltransferase